MLDVYWFVVFEVRRLRNFFIASSFSANDVKASVVKFCGRMWVANRQHFEERYCEVETLLKRK
jgi:hypothetical protein